MTTKPIIGEQLADLMHEIWSSWMIHLFSKCELNADDGTMIIPASLVQRWQRQIDTPYSELSDSEKDSDRRQAIKVMYVISKFFGST